jgi:predicted DNA-binding protein (UPF0251 family)
MFSPVHHYVGNDSDLKDTLTHLDDLTFLQDCALSRTHYVLSQLHGDETTVPKAHAVRDLLNNALKLLRGSDVRSDMAIDWQNYNILFFRYFKQHFSNSQIAARLGISQRTFFRQQDRAIEALLMALLELDAAFQRSNNAISTTSA